MSNENVVTQSDYQRSNVSQLSLRPVVVLEIMPGRKRKIADGDGGNGNKKHKGNHQTLDRFNPDNSSNTNAGCLQFTRWMDLIIEAFHDVDVNEMIGNEEEVVELGTDSLIDASILKDLCNEALRLKALSSANQISKDSLVKLLQILQLSMNFGCKVTMVSGGSANLINILSFLGRPNEDEDDKSSRNIKLEKLTAAVDACLTAMLIMTMKNVPKEVYIEDVIERVVCVAKTQLDGTIYQIYDPISQIDKENDSSRRGKRSRASCSKDRKIVDMYLSFASLLNLLADLVERQQLTDTIVLQMSSLSVASFFVENIPELQLNSLKLVTNIFRRYENHRSLIQEDILSSLAKLPSSKQNLRSYRLQDGLQIQMMTALALQLVQSTVMQPKTVNLSMNSELLPRLKIGKENQRAINAGSSPLVDLKMQENILILSYEGSMKTAYTFLYIFLSKCTAKGEKDYRPLFNNFIQDLLSLVHRPEWPATELFIVILGPTLLKQFTTRSIDSSARVASLDYLGTIAAALRRSCTVDANTTQLVRDFLDQQKKTEKEKISESEEITLLQRTVLDWLMLEAGKDSSLQFSRNFFLAQWCRDDMKARESFESNSKQTGVSKALEYCLKREPTDCNNTSVLSYEQILAFLKYLSSKGAFNQWNEGYLSQILSILRETNIALRTKALNCLTRVIEAEPSLLERTDVQKCVSQRIMDQSIKVREAAIDLIGRFLIIHPQLINQYYDVLSDRILDVGISVRKSVIKIFRDICLRHPGAPKISDMCVRMIRRVDDEEGIKKLVTETFQSMWFTRISNDVLQQQIKNIIDVVAACRLTGYDWLENLIRNLLKQDRDTRSKVVTKSCVMIIDGLVENIPDLVQRLDGNDSTERLTATFAALHVFCKLDPELLVKHSIALHPFMRRKFSTKMDNVIRQNIASILELSVPLMSDPPGTFLDELQEDLLAMVMSQTSLVVQSCVSCLSVLRKCGRLDMISVHDHFVSYLNFLHIVKQNPGSEEFKNRQNCLLRSVYVVGLICKHFDEVEFGKNITSDFLFNLLFYFTEYDHEEVRHNALTGLGYFTTRHYRYLLNDQLKKLYIDFLTKPEVTVNSRCQVLKNLQMYLEEEETKMVKADAEWKKTHNQVSLKEMADVQSGMGSTIMQVYMKHILDSFFHVDSKVRICALEIVGLVLHQGLVHPGQCIPFLICMGSDSDPAIRVKADNWLQTIDKKYNGFVSSKALHGIRLSYKLHQLISPSATDVVRGSRDEESPIGHNSFVYSLLRSNRGYRRTLLNSLLKLFENKQEIDLKELVYVADNLAHFPYIQHDEPLFVIHKLDTIVSSSGSTTLESFNQIFHKDKKLTKKKKNGSQARDDDDDGYEDEEDDDDDEEDLETLLGLMPKNTDQLERLFIQSQHCLLLLVLKKHLKALYGIKDKIIEQYSPTDGAKLHDKPLNRKAGVKFDPKAALDIIRRGRTCSRRDIAEAYINFKQLMMTIDPADKENDQ